MTCMRNMHGVNNKMKHCEHWTLQGWVNMDKLTTGCVVRFATYFRHCWPDPTRHDPRVDPTCGHLWLRSVYRNLPFIRSEWWLLITSEWWLLCISVLSSINFVISSYVLLPPLSDPDKCPKMANLGRPLLRKLTNVYTVIPEECRTVDRCKARLQELRCSVQDRTKYE